ncbi:2794_t:CDS:2, partial [Racocetra fulgida]
TACDRGIAYIFQTGVTPVAMSEFTSGFNISTDLALSEEFWDLYGFKQSEVELLLDNALRNNLPSDVKKGIVKWLKEENDGYFFNPNQAEDSSNIIKKFLRFPPDPNTLPSQTILELIGNNSLGKSILTEALNRSPLESRNEETLLKPLKDNSIKHSNEEALKQSFIDTLILTLHANIEPEFQVNSQNSNLAIEFDNIRMEYINLNGAQVSRSLMMKLEDEILSLEISDPYRPDQKTVHEALE